MLLEPYYVPIDPGDLRRIAEQLRSADVFTPTFLAPEVDHYDPAIYLQQSHRFATGTVLRVDRNVFTRLLGMVRGHSPSDAHRISAGVLAFAQCADIDVEPNIALYEGAQLHGQEAALDELKSFRIADNVHPGYWAEIALGRCDQVGEVPEMPMGGPGDSEVDFTMPLRRWRRNYVLCLKLAALELSGGGASQRLQEFIRWSYNDFILGGPAIALAAHYLAPNGRRKRLLKSLRSEDRERAIGGVRNAAWDLTLVSEWLLDIESQEQSSRLVLLTSLDAGVHNLARAVAETSRSANSSEDALRVTLRALWGEAAGNSLATEVEGLYGSREAPHRRIHDPSPPETVDDLIAAGEARIRAWKPHRADV